MSPASSLSTPAVSWPSSPSLAKMPVRTDIIRQLYNDRDKKKRNMKKETMIMMMMTKKKEKNIE